MTKRKPTIALIVSTTRHARVGRDLAEALLPLLQEHEDIRAEIVDLAEVALPWLDEPQPPSQGNYQMESTRRWAAQVSSWDGVLVLSAQYNGGYPAPLKNAIDTVYAEWQDKPTAVVTYGGQGSEGGRSAGQQLRTVFGVTGNSVVEPGAAIVLKSEDYDEKQKLVGPESIIERNREQLQHALNQLIQSL